MAVFTAAFGSNDGVLNGSSEVTLVAAPASGYTRTVRQINITNVGAETVTVTVALANGASRRTICKCSLWQNDNLGIGDNEVIILDSTSKSIVCSLSSSPATNPDFTASWVDETHA